MKTACAGGEVGVLAGNRKSEGGATGDIRADERGRARVPDIQNLQFAGCKLGKICVAPRNHNSVVRQ